MKRFQLFSLASAMLLASAAGFTSCSSDSEDPQAGGSGVAGQVVKTQFVINIPYAGNESGGNARVSTRMTAENTQNNNNFLGLKDIKMFAFNEDPTSETNPTSTRTIRIGTDASSSNNDYRRIYSDIAIPVGTTHMILYARATRTKTVEYAYKNKTNFEAGSLTNPYGNFKDDAKPNLSDFKFNLEAIHKNNDFNEKGQAILTKLNAIANTKTSDGQKWSEIGNSPTADNDAKILKSLYEKFIRLTAGSANSVNRFIVHLKEAIESQGVKTPMAEAIKTNCTTVISTTNFPRNLDLPDGVVRVKFDPTNKFTFVTANNSTVSTGSDLIDYTTVTYPSELAYFVSSPLKTSTTDTKLNDLPSYNNWLAGTETWEGYKNIVQNNTLFVALQNPVQYGVACLKSSIKCASTSLEDNAKKIVSSESDNTITVDDNSFPVTGILIGGQPKGVKWDFEPASTNQPGDFKYTIYDNDMNSSNFTAKVEAGTLPYNYTLVLDNKDTSGSATQSNVNVVIELENNAADFYGAEGLIPKGSKFYLAGTLDLTATNRVTKPNDLKVDHVFVKDHTTVANFTIKDLKKAYNCIPDLRTSKINVGLAVDLKWETGIQFDVDL